jgi:predicted DNA-binding transcriptional regulator YafY
MTTGTKNANDKDKQYSAQGQWARVIWLDQEIRAERFPSVAGLRETFCVARRTAFNTVNFLRDSLGAPLAYSSSRRGYYYTDPTYGLPAVFLREGEVLAILLAEQVTRQYLGTPLERPLRDAIEKISRYLPQEVQVELGDLAAAFHFSGGTGLEPPLGVMMEVQRALRQRCLLKIRYYTASRDEISERVIEPHFLNNVRGDWLLVAWDRDRADDRVFMVARIRECRLLSERFELRAELRPESYATSMFLTEHDWKPEEVLLRFDAYQARWIRERTWHPTQELEDLPGGGLLLRLRVSIGGDLERWILGYGSHVEVMEPLRLRERVAEELAQGAARYGEPGAARGEAEV